MKNIILVVFLLSFFVAISEVRTEELNGSGSSSMAGYSSTSGHTGFVITIPENMGFVTLGGYADFECEDFENTNFTFDQNKLGIILGAELLGRLRFYTEYVINHGGPAASGKGDSEVEQAWFDYLITPRFNARAGLLVVPFGRYNTRSNPDMLDLAAHPILTQTVVPVVWAESGAGIWGEFFLLEWNRNCYFKYEAYMINGFDNNFSDDGLKEAIGSVENDNNNPVSYVGRFEINYGKGCMFGISGYNGKYDQFDNYITGAGVDLFLTEGPLEFLGEYTKFTVEQAGSAKPEYLKGYYVQANYHFWFEVFDKTFLGKSFNNPAFTLIGRYGFVAIDDDLDFGIGNNKEKRYTLGLNYRPIENWVFKFEYQWNITGCEALDRGNKDGFTVSVAMGF